MNRIKKNNKRKIQKNCVLFGIVVLSFFLFLLSSKYTFLEEEKQNENPTFAYYIDGELSTEIPNKDLGYTLSSESYCNNGVTISWDDESYSAAINYSNFQLGSHKRTYCELHFEKAVFSTLRSVTMTDTKGMWKYRNTISRIVIQSNNPPISDSIETTDESDLQDGSVMSYVVLNDDGTTHTAYLQGNGHLLLNENSSYLFYDFKALTTIEGIENLDSSKVVNMSYMFGGTRYGMSSLTSLDLSHFDTSSVTDMSNMFALARSLTSLDLSHFDTSNVTNMNSMFLGMSGLIELDISNFDTSSVTDMYGMFGIMNSLISLDVSSFNTSNVVNMNRMFYSCHSLTSLNLSNFDTSNVTDMYSMFASDSNLKNIIYGEKFVRKADSQIDSMFNNCPANKPTHSSWSSVTW